MKRPGIIAKTLSRARSREPMEVLLTVKLNMGDRPSEAVTLVDERRVPLVGSVFENRDRIAREFVRLLVKAGGQQPEVVRRLFGLRGGRNK